MIASLAAVVLSTASAAGYATAAVAQERLAAGQTPQEAPLRLLRSWRWWLAIAPNGLGAALHVAALRYGSVVLVQPFGALTLVFALPLGATVVGRHVTGREWRGAVAVLIGLTVLTLASDLQAPERPPGGAASAVLAAATLLVVAALARPAGNAGTAPPAGTAVAGPGGGAGTAVRHRIGRGWALRLAIASGVASGVASVLTQAVLLRLPTATTATGATVVLLTTAAVVGFAVGGLLLAQVAYAGGLGLPLAMLTIANPVVTTAIGLTMAGARSAVSAQAVAATLLAVAVVSRGVLLLAAPDPH